MTKPHDVTCPTCGGPMVPRDSRYGKFWGCREYPRCRGTRDSMGRTLEERQADARKDTREKTE